MKMSKTNALSVFLSKAIEEEVERQLTIKLSTFEKVKDNEDKLLSLEQILKTMGVSDTTLYRYRKDKGLDAFEIKIGKQIYFKESGFYKWLIDNNKKVNHVSR